MTDDAGFVLLRLGETESQVEAWAFALHAVGIDHRVESVREGAWGLWVSPGSVTRSGNVLAALDREERERSLPTEPAVPDHGQSLSGVAVAFALCAFFWVTGQRGGDDPVWFRAGSAVAENIVDGQWWRAVTALTLHADASHVLGNAVACVIFLSPLARWLGDGLAVWLMAAAGTLGNLATAYLYGHHHDSVGASTATFGALGLLGGLQIVRWAAGAARPGGGPRRAWVVVAACLGLFAVLGVGPRSDVVAHLMGLASGLLLGAISGRVVRRPLPLLVQFGFFAATVASVLGCWSLALR